MLLGIAAAAAVAKVLFAYPLFHSYIRTSLHLFVHHLSVYKE